MKNLLVVAMTIMSFTLSAQGFRSIGVEASGMMIAEISSSGVDGSNYSVGINTEYALCDFLSITSGLKYNKYGSHTSYTQSPILPESRFDDLTKRSAYKINSVAIPVAAKLNTKYFSLYIGAQGDKFIFQSPEVTYMPLAKEDLDFENYDQSDLRKYNLSAIGGIEFKRNFGNNIEMFARPSAQYFMKPFYTNGGFEDVKWNYNFTVGANYLLGGK